jgi:hypothetical protein
MRSQKFSQPRFAQSVSNFQTEYLEAIRKVIQSLTKFQGTFIEYSWINFDNKSAFYTEQIRNQVNTLAKILSIRTCDIWNQITLNLIDISKENIKMYTQAITSMETHNRSLISSGIHSLFLHIASNQKNFLTLIDPRYINLNILPA